MNAVAIAAILRGYELRFRNERELQSAIEDVLTRAHVVFRREVEITAADRIDFLCERLGLEVKVDSSAPAVLRQIHRYAQCPDIDEILLVTSRLKHRNMIPPTLNGKPIEVLALIRL